MNPLSKRTNLTGYELRCGGVQWSKIGADKIELYHEHGVYHVRRFADHVDGRRVCEAWINKQTLAEARKAFKCQCDVAKAAAL